MSESGTRDRLHNDLVLLLDVYPGDEYDDGMMEGVAAMKDKVCVLPVQLAATFLMGIAGCSLT